MKIRWILEGEQECETLEEVPKDARILTIDGRHYMGPCEVCGAPAFELDREDETFQFMDLTLCDNHKPGRDQLRLILKHFFNGPDESLAKQDTETIK